MRILKYILEFFLSPLGLLTLLLFGGLLLSLRKDHWISAKRWFTAAAILYFLFLCTPVGELAFGSLEQRYPALLNPETAGARYIVILSAYAERSSNAPITSNLSEETLCRLVEGMRVYRRVPESKIVVSGGVVRRGDPSIAALMADFLVALGIPARDILIEGESQDTFENLRNSSRFVQQNPFYLVTSACHLRRAMAVAKKLKMKAIACPAQILTLQAHPAGRSWQQWAGDMARSISLPSTGRLKLIQLSFHEYVGYLWYRLLGRL